MFYRFNSVPETIIDSQQFSQTSLDDSSIKILNWNIAKNNHKPEWQQDFYRMLKQYEPDLMFFQEVRLDVNQELLLGNPEIGWNFAPNLIDPAKAHYFGVLTASKVKHLSRKPLLSQVYEPFFKTPKVSLLTQYPLLQSRQTLAAVNFHGINFVKARLFQSQLQQLEWQLNQHSGPLILSGDFNTWSRSRMKFLLRMTEGLNLKKVRFKSTESKKIKRFLLSDPLDHIFYRGLQEKPGSAKVFDHISSSDHKPMFVQLCIPDSIGSNV